MAEKDKDKEWALSRFDPAKRDTIRKIIMATGFAVPTVASFTMDGLTLNHAHALGLTHS